jgi:hypothetical protein
MLCLSFLDVYVPILTIDIHLNHRYLSIHFDGVQDIFFEPPWGTQYLTGDDLKVVWAGFSSGRDWHVISMP